MIKRIQDYIPKLKEQFPNISESDIRRCVNYGWQMFYYYNLLGCDVSIKDKNLWFYCGSMYFDSLLYFNYYRKRLSKKIRTLHHRKRIPWDGYYYTVVDKPKKNKLSNYEIKDKYIFKLLDEAKLFYDNEKYFVKFYYPVNLGYRRFKEKMKIKKAELVFVREKPLTFKDILYSSNKYDIK